MSVSEEPRQADLEQAQAALKEGLNSCRAIIRGYRELMGDELVSRPEHPSPDNDDDSSVDLN